MRSTLQRSGWRDLTCETFRSGSEHAAQHIWRCAIFMQASGLHNRLAVSNNYLADKLVLPVLNFIFWRFFRIFVRKQPNSLLVTLQKICHVQPKIRTVLLSQFRGFVPCSRRRAVLRSAGFCDVFFWRQPHHSCVLLLFEGALGIMIRFVAAPKETEPATRKPGA